MTSKAFFALAVSAGCFISVVRGNSPEDLIFEATVNAFEAFIAKPSPSTEPSNFKPTISGRQRDIWNLVAREAHLEAQNRNSNFYSSPDVDDQLNELRNLYKKVYQSAASGWHWSFVTNLGKYIAALSHVYITRKKFPHSNDTGYLGLPFHVADTAGLKKLETVIVQFLTSLFRKVNSQTQNALLGQCHRNLTIICYMETESHKTPAFRQLLQRYLTNRINKQFQFCPHAIATVVDCPQLQLPLKQVTRDNEFPSLSKVLLDLLWNHDVATDIFIVTEALSENRQSRQQLATLFQLAYQQLTRVNTILFHRPTFQVQMVREDLFRGSLPAAVDLNNHLSGVYMTSMITGGSTILYHLEMHPVLHHAVTQIPAYGSDRSRLLVNRIYGSTESLSIPTDSVDSLFVTVLCAAHREEDDLVSVHMNGEEIFPAAHSLPGYFVKSVKTPNTAEIKLLVHIPSGTECHVTVVGELTNGSTTDFWLLDNLQSRLRIHDKSAALKSRWSSYTSQNFFRADENSPCECVRDKTDLLTCENCRPTAQLHTITSDKIIFSRPVLPETECRNADLKFEVWVGRSEVAVSPKWCGRHIFSSCTTGSGRPVVDDSYDPVTLDSCRDAHAKQICAIGYDSQISNDVWEIERSTVVCIMFIDPIDQRSPQWSVTVVNTTACKRLEACEKELYYVQLETVGIDGSNLVVLAHHYKNGEKTTVEAKVTRRNTLEHSTDCCFDRGEIVLVDQNGKEFVHSFQSSSVNKTATKWWPIICICLTGGIVVLIIIIIVVCVVCKRRSENNEEAKDKDSQNRSQSIPQVARNIHKGSTNTKFRIWECREPTDV